MPQLGPLITGPHHNHRVDSLYATRELVQTELQRRGCKDLQAAWSLTLEAAMTELAPFVVSVALRVSGLIPTPSTALKSNNTSGHRGVDFNRGRWRARCWKGGKLVWQLSSIDKERVIAARAKFLAGQQ